jgi:RHS repeat-associated protein
LQMPGRSQQQYGSPLTDVKYTGYELNQEGGLGLYHAGARLYDPAVGRFMQQDRFKDRYPSMTPYQYAANNPVLFIDVNGDSVVALTEEEQELIVSTLNKNDRNYVRFDSDGRLDTELLSQAGGDSGNLAALITLAQHKTVFVVQLSGEFVYADADGNLHTMEMGEISVDPTWQPGIYTLSTLELGFAGQTLLPGTSEAVNSPNSNAYIIINPGLSPLGRAETFAHEGFGHGYMFARGLDSAHRVDGMKETNIPLRNQIMERMYETRKNFLRNR